MLLLSLFSLVCSRLLSATTQDPLPRTAHCRWTALPHQSLIKRMPQRLKEVSRMEVNSSIEIPSSQVTLVTVRLIKANQDTESMFLYQKHPIPMRILGLHNRRFPLMLSWKHRFLHTGCLQGAKLRAGLCTTTHTDTSVLPNPVIESSVEFSRPWLLHLLSASKNLIVKFTYEMYE